MKKKYQKIVFVFVLVAMLGFNFAPSSAVASYNLIKNFDMETEGASGNPEGWIRGNWGTNTAVFSYPIEGWNGLKAVKVEITERTSGDAKWAWDHVPLEPGKEYYYEDSRKSNVSSYLTAEYMLENGEYIYEDLAQPGPTENWHPSTATFTVPEGVVSGRVFHLINQVGELSIDSAWLVEVEQPASEPDPITEITGMVSLTFDDGNKEMYETVIPLLTKYNLKSTQYLVTRYLGFPAYITQNQALVMDRLGHEIGAHTIAHRDLTLIPIEESREEIVGSREALLSIGVSKVETFAYPFGAYNQDLKNLLATEGFTSARTTDGGLNTEESTDLYALKRVNMGPEITLEQVKARIDEAVEDNKWLVFAFHHINDSGSPYSVSEEFLTEVLEYLKTNSVPVVTISEGANLID